MSCFLEDNLDPVAPLYSTWSILNYCLWYCRVLIAFLVSMNKLHFYSFILAPFNLLYIYLFVIVTCCFYLFSVKVETPWKNRSLFYSLINMLGMYGSAWVIISTSQILSHKQIMTFLCYMRRLTEVSHRGQIWLTSILYCSWESVPSRYNFIYCYGILYIMNMYYSRWLIKSGLANSRSGRDWTQEPN